MLRYERYKNGRHWAVYDIQDQLINIFVYKRGAIEFIKLILELKGQSEEEIAKSLAQAEFVYQATKQASYKNHIYQAHS